jgi:hypothetical protein
LEREVVFCCVRSGREDNYNTVLLKKLPVFFLNKNTIIDDAGVLFVNNGSGGARGARRVVKSSPRRVVKTSLLALLLFSMRAVIVESYFQPSSMENWGDAGVLFVK